MALRRPSRRKDESLMEPRIAYNKYSPNALHAMYALEKHLKSSSIEEKLLHLVKLRASQINGCAYCIDMHSKDARAGGCTRNARVRPQRLARNAILHSARTRRPRL